MDNIKLIYEFESQQELAEFVENAKNAKIGHEFKNNFLINFDWFIDANPKAKPQEIKEWIQRFINERE